MLILSIKGASKMHYELDTKTGTVGCWNVGGTNVFFPEQWVDLDGQRKHRGGAHLCCPIFGSQPDESYYAVTDLPKHGLARLGDHHLNSVLTVSQQSSEIELDYDGYSEFPWAYSSRSTISLSSMPCFELTHSLTVRRSEDSERPDDMPLSMAWHPYFSTYGKPFSVTYAYGSFHQGCFESGRAYFWARRGCAPLVLSLCHGEIHISLGGGEYDHFYLWTDSPSRYFCVEPVLGKPNNTQLLKPGESRTGVCTVRYYPK